MLLNYNLLSAFAWLTWNHLAAWTVNVVNNSHLFINSSGCCFSCPRSAHLWSKAASCWLFLNINNVTSKCFSFNITCGMLVHHQLTLSPSDGPQRADDSITIDTTLLVHFFGKKGKAELTFDDFYRYRNILLQLCLALFLFTWVVLCEVASSTHAY